MAQKHLRFCGQARLVDANQKLSYCIIVLTECWGGAKEFSPFSEKKDLAIHRGNIYAVRGISSNHGRNIVLILHGSLSSFHATYLAGLPFVCITTYRSSGLSLPLRTSRLR